MRFSDFVESETAVVVVYWSHFLRTTGASVPESIGILGRAGRNAPNQLSVLITHFDLFASLDFVQRDVAEYIADRPSRVSHRSRVVRKLEFRDLVDLSRAEDSKHVSRHDGLLATL
jgi:hypothetical protein